MSEPQIVSATYSEVGVITHPESGGRVRLWLRALGRRLGLVKHAPALDLFQMNMGAFRFLTDDGRACLVPVTRELVRDIGREQAEEIARREALTKLAA